MQIEYKWPSSTFYKKYPIFLNNRKSIGIRVEISEIHHDSVSSFYLNNPVAYRWSGRVTKRITQGSKLSGRFV